MQSREKALAYPRWSRVISTFCAFLPEPSTSCALLEKAVNDVPLAFHPIVHNLSLASAPATISTGASRLTTLDRTKLRHQLCGLLTCEGFHGGE